MGVGVSAVVPPIVNSGAFFGGCERCFGVSWIICRLVGKFGLQSILRLQIGVLGLWWGLVSLLGGVGGVLALSRLTASNCGWGSTESLVTTAARVSAVLSVLVAVRPAVPARRLPFLPGVLCKGCPCSRVGVPGSVAAVARLSFGVGVRLG